MCEEKQKTELAKLKSSFWQDGIEAVEQGVRKDMLLEDEEHDEQESFKECLTGVVVS